MAPEKPQQPNEGGDNQKRDILHNTKEALKRFLKRLGIMPILHESKREQKNLILKMKKEAKNAQRNDTSKKLRSILLGKKRESSESFPPLPNIQKEFEKNFQEIVQKTEYPLDFFLRRNFPKISDWLKKKMFKEKIHIPLGIKQVTELVVGAADSIITSAKLGINIAYDAGKFVLKPKKEFLRTWYVWDDRDDNGNKRA